MKTSLLATLVLCAAGLPAQDHPELTDAVTTTLTKIRNDPDAFRNVKVQFVAQFAALGKISNPFFTQFTPTEYSNVYAWGDDQPIWQRAAYDDLFGNLFYPKGGSQLEQLFELRMYQRLQMTAIVRNTFQDAPWIEIVDFTPVEGQVDSAVLAHMYRGEQFMAERRWQRAIAELTLAPGADVPHEVLRSAYKNLGICYLRIGESDQALSCLRQAASYTTTFDAEIQDLIATTETKPSAELDRVVEQQGVKDFERPMWEAFEQETPGARKARPLQ